MGRYVTSTSLLPRLRWEVGTPVKWVSTWDSVKWGDTWYVLASQAKMGSRYTSEVGDGVKWGDTMHAPRLRWEQGTCMYSHG